MKSYAVIGMGLFGSQIAMELYKKGANVMAIDTNASLIEKYAGNVTKAVVADAKKRDVLRKLGVDKCDCAIVALTSDLASSVLITMNLKALGIKQIICKSKDDTDKEVLETLGATNIVIPEKMSAERLSVKLLKPNVMDYIELSDNCGIVEIQAPQAWINHSIIDLNIRAKFGVNVIGIKKGSQMNVSFDGKTLLEEGDVLVLVGDNKNLNKIQSVH